MVVFPRFSENITLVVDLVRDIVTQLLQSVLELLLEGVERGMDIIHSLHGLLLIVSNFAVIELC